jgi:hypothetical protein
MSRAILSPSKLKQLRGIEQYTYQVAHYILQDECLAEEAAKEALLEISSMEPLMKGSTEELHCLVKKLTISASIKVAARLLPTA